ncbi:Mu transposase domain-containing protein [Streptomyces sp. NPDC054866]
MEHPHLQPWQRTVTTPHPACSKNKERTSRSSVNTPEVSSLAELNEMVEQWDRQDDARRIGARPKTVAEYFGLEQPLLMPLPEEPFETGRVFTPRVDRYGQIPVRTNRYSVPIRLIGKRVRVVLHASHLVVYDQNVEVARHERLIAKGAVRLDLDHYLEVLVRKPGAFPGSTALEQARSAGRFTPVHDAWWDPARKIHGERDGTRALIESSCWGVIFPTSMSSPAWPPLCGPEP